VNNKLYRLSLTEWYLVMFKTREHALEANVQVPCFAVRLSTIQNRYVIVNKLESLPETDEFLIQLIGPSVCGWTLVKSYHFTTLFENIWYAE